MKRILLSSLLGCSALFAFGQTGAEKLFDKDHTIDLLVVYDDTEWQYEENFENARETFAQEVVNSLNLVLKNSNINDYAYRVAGTCHWAGYKSSTIDQALNDAMNNAQWNNVIPNKRRETKADVVLILTKNDDTNSGAAVPSANHADAYACVRRSMAASAFTAAHEIGHILGANHSDSSGEQQPSDHPWAKGYVTPDGNMMTVLCSMGSALPIYSGPNSIWTTEDGTEVVMGDATHDNVRMIKSMLPGVVHFGDQLEANAYYTSAEEMRFTSAAQQGEVRVASNAFMQITSNCDWITQVTPGFCTNDDAAVQFALSANTTGHDRTGSIVLSGDAPTKEIKITQTAADVNVDSDHGSSTPDGNHFVNKAQFVRTFNNTEWQSLYVPFLWRNSDWKDLFDIAELKLVQETGNGELALTIVPLTTEDVKAHVPYMIRAKKVNKYVVDLQNVNFFPAAATPVEFTVGNQKFAFTGTCHEILGQDMYNNGFYGMSNGVLGKSGNVNAKLGAFRWYLSVTENGEPAKAPLKIKVVEQQDGVTGIENAAATQQSFDVYDMNGRLLKKNAKDTEGLQHGIYVVNGKKVVL